MSAGDVVVPGAHGSDFMFFWCPGCNEAHGVSTLWTFNGNMARPTITPSIAVRGVQWASDSDFHNPEHATVAPGGATMCHSYVTDGQIQFLEDCTHRLRGQTVQLPEWSEVTDNGVAHG